MAALATATYFAITTDLYGWEVDISRWLQGFSLGPARFLRQWVFWMGIKGMAGGMVLLTMGYALYRRRKLEALCLILISVPDLFNILLREILARPRPTSDLIDVVGGPQGFSFPSGTTLHTLLFYGFLMYLADGFVLSRRWVFVLRSLGVLYIVISGLWVLYDGRHWFTDAIGGYIYGAFYLLVLIVFYRWASERLRIGDAVRVFTRFPRFVSKPVEFAFRLMAQSPPVT